uniref:NEDD8-conjugating enzyme UBC12 n=1 Tax=Anas platyrhynchos TaxID=8839 RepID=A0A8B9ZH26_ANAPL
ANQSASNFLPATGLADGRGRGGGKSRSFPERHEGGGEVSAEPERAEAFRKEPRGRPRNESRSFRTNPEALRGASRTLSGNLRSPPQPPSGFFAENPEAVPEKPEVIPEIPEAVPEIPEAPSVESRSSSGDTRSLFRNEPRSSSGSSRRTSRRSPKAFRKSPNPSVKARTLPETPEPLPESPEALPEKPEALPEVAERCRPLPPPPRLSRLRSGPGSAAAAASSPPGGAQPRLRRPPPGPGPGPGPGSGPGPGRMIKLFSLKQQKKEEESAGGTRGTSKKASAAQLRIQKDINELNLPKTCEIDFSDQDDLLHFRLLICPDEGFYKGGKFVFSFKVGQGYPHDPPKVKCETMVYHPNIDLEGNVCLNILREDWKPVLTINSIIYGLQYLFLEPNPEDPLNKEAAEVLQSNRRLFEQNVQRSLRGGYVGATYFERCLK